MEYRKGKVRNERQARRWVRKMERYRYLNGLIKKEALDILHSNNFRLTKEYKQHGNVNVNTHVLSVARHSIVISEALKIKCNQEDLIRGALLHDYFLYDWHKPDKENPHHLHGFFHASRALRNASKEYHLTNRQKDIIEKHMWPLTVKPPMCREAWIVTMADKWCSTMETLHIHKGHGVIINKRRGN